MNDKIIRNNTSIRKTWRKKKTKPQVTKFLSKYKLAAKKRSRKCQWDGKESTNSDPDRKLKGALQSIVFIMVENQIKTRRNWWKVERLSSKVARPITRLSWVSSALSFTGDRRNAFVITFTNHLPGYAFPIVVFMCGFCVFTVFKGLWNCCSHLSHGFNWFSWDQNWCVHTYLPS